MKNKTLESIFKDIDVLGINGGYSVEQLLSPQDCRMLKSTIKDLQEENERLRKELEKYTDVINFKVKQFSIKEVNKLQERIDEAIDYIDNNSISWDVDYDDNYYEWYTGFEEENIKELLNILQGSDE